MTPLLVNFGGPRTTEEIFPFLKELLCDPDVIRTKLPRILQNFLFTRIARKRSVKIRHDYELIGGSSPIYFDTEYLSQKISSQIQTEVLTFHRYLPKTHKRALERIENTNADEIRILPLFPQFTYATSGSIARFFSQRLSNAAKKKLRWIPSYPDNPLYIQPFQKKIRDFLLFQNLLEEETFFLFSAHGLPQDFVDLGDPYQKECERSFLAILKTFPKALGKLCYQSKFGRGEWIKPYTEEVCKNILSFNQGRRNIVFIPLSFTSDHIETLFEVEYQYLPLIQSFHLKAYRCPALNRETYWIDALCTLFQEKSIIHKKNNDLIFS